MLSGWRSGWRRHWRNWRLAARRDELDDGDVDVIIAEINKLPANDPKVRDELRKEAQYFETNKLRMCYKYFRRRGFFVGSGVVEAGSKTLIGHRLKQSGMRWTVTGANAVIALRCRLLGNRWKTSGAPRPGWAKVRC